MKQMSDYKVPRAASIPVPDLNKPKQGKRGMATLSIIKFWCTPI